MAKLCHYCCLREAKMDFMVNATPMESASEPMATANRSKDGRMERNSLLETTYRLDTSQVQPLELIPGFG